MESLHLERGSGASNFVLRSTATVLGTDPSTQSQACSRHDDDNAYMVPSGENQNFALQERAKVPSVLCHTRVRWFVRSLARSLARCRRVMPRVHLVTPSRPPPPPRIRITYYYLVW